jgi:hypothetical protein
MRAIHFWILLLGSCLVSALMIKQIFLSRSIRQEQRLLADSQETIAAGPGYENAWTQLAIHIYQASHQDPDLAAVLKSENLTIKPKPPAGSTDSSTPSTPPPSPTSTKTPAATPHPAAAPTP